MAKLKCKICEKKLNSLMADLYTCKCGKVYCREKHMFAHNCPYNYHKDTQKRLEKNMPVVVSDKVVKI